MTDDERNELEYLIELIVGGIVFESEWYYDMVLSDPQKMDRFVSIAEELVKWAVIDSKVNDMPPTEAKAVIERVMTL